LAAPIVVIATSHIQMTISVNHKSSVADKITADLVLGIIFAENALDCVAYSHITHLAVHLQVHTENFPDIWIVPDVIS